MYDPDPDLHAAPTDLSTALAHGGLVDPTDADWDALAERVPLLRTVLAGQSLGRTGERRERRQSLIGTILNRRPTWRSEPVVERFRATVAARDGQQPSDPRVVELILEEMRGWCRDFARGAGRSFRRDELRTLSRSAARSGELDTQAALDALIDAEGGRDVLGITPLDATAGTLIGAYLARKFPRRALRALYDTLRERIWDLTHPFSRAAIEAWQASRGDLPALVTLDISATGKPLGSEPNATAALFELGLPVALNERSQAVMVRGPLPWDLVPPTEDRPLLDADVGMLGRWAARTYGLHLPSAVWHVALATYAHRQGYDPVQEYFRALPRWDGVPRWTTLLQRTAGAPRETIYGTMVARWAISAVARTMSPGCKADTLLVVVGPQGAGKSRLGRVLCAQSDWYQESYSIADGKDAVLKLHDGSWIVEYGELTGITVRDAEAVKALLSCAEDHVRLPYARIARTLQRRCVLLGTANPRGSGLFVDPTGSRRFWPVPVGPSIDLATVARERDMLWAEAYRYFCDGIPWWLSEDEQSPAETVAEEHQVEDPFVDAAYEYLYGLRKKQPRGDLFVRTKEVLAAAGHMQPYRKSDVMHMADAIKRIGGTAGRYQGRRVFRFDAER